MFTRVIHYESDTPNLAICGNYGVGNFTRDLKQITCKACINNARTRRNQMLVQDRKNSEFRGGAKAW